MKLFSYWYIFWITVVSFLIRLVNTERVSYRTITYDCHCCSRKCSWFVLSLVTTCWFHGGVVWNTGMLWVRQLPCWGRGRGRIHSFIFLRVRIVLGPVSLDKQRPANLWRIQKDGLHALCGSQQRSSKFEIHYDHVPWNHYWIGYWSSLFGLNRTPQTFANKQHRNHGNHMARLAFIQKVVDRFRYFVPLSWLSEFTVY